MTKIRFHGHRGGGCHRRRPPPAQQRGTPPRAARPGVDWPAFRGIDANGIVQEGRPAPTTFTPAAAAWRTKIPGLGNSSPVIWGDLLCVTTAISSKDNSFKPGLYGNVEPVEDSSPHEWKVMCLDKRTGATAVGADGPQGRTEGEAAHEVDARELDARDRWHAPGRDVGLRGAAHVRHERAILPVG